MFVGHKVERVNALHSNGWQSVLISLMLLLQSKTDKLLRIILPKIARVSVLIESNVTWHLPCARGVRPIAHVRSDLDLGIGEFAQVRFEVIDDVHSLIVDLAFLLSLFYLLPR